MLYEVQWVFSSRMSPGMWQEASVSLYVICMGVFCFLYNLLKKLNLRSYFPQSSEVFPEVFLHPAARRALKVALSPPLQLHPCAECCALALLSRRCWDPDQQQEGLK